MSGPTNHSNIPDDDNESPIAGSPSDHFDSAQPAFSGAETEATRLNYAEDEYPAAARRSAGGKVLAILTAIGLIAAAALGGRMWWSHHETNKAFAALVEEGAMITDQGSQVRIVATNDSFQDEDLLILVGISGPIQLMLSDNSEITDKGLAHLNGMTNITGLDIGKTGVTDAGMAHLATLTNLERLDISFNRSITDKGVRHLSGLVRLKELTMPATSVSDACVDPLTNLARLEFLVIGSTKVTAAGEKRIKDAIPELIVFRSK